MFLLGEGHPLPPAGTDDLSIPEAMAAEAMEISRGLLGAAQPGAELGSLHRPVPTHGHTNHTEPEMVSLDRTALPHEASPARVHPHTSVSLSALCWYLAPPQRAPYSLQLPAAASVFPLLAGAPQPGSESSAPGPAPPRGGDRPALSPAPAQFRGLAHRNAPRPVGEPGTQLSCCPYLRVGFCLCKLNLEVKHLGRRLLLLLSRCFLLTHEFSVHVLSTERSCCQTENRRGEVCNPATPQLCSTPTPNLHVPPSRVGWGELWGLIVQHTQ